MLYREWVEYLFLGGREFPHLYHLPDKTLHLVVSILPSTVRSSSLSLCVRCPLADREASEVVNLLFIISDQFIILGKRDFRSWVLKPSFQQFFLLESLRPFSPRKPPCFPLFRKLKFLRKWNFLLDKFSWESEYSWSYPWFFHVVVYSIVCPL